MKTSTYNLTLVATLAALATASNAFAIGPGGFSMKSIGGGKRISINSIRNSTYNNGKHLEMKPGRISAHSSSGKHNAINDGHVATHGSSKHVEIYNGSLDRSYGAECSSKVVYTTPPVNHAPAPQQEVTYSPPTTWVNYQPEAPVYDPTDYVNSGLEPVNSSYVIEPGDTFYEVSLKMYRTSDAAEAIATYNQIPMNAPLRPGQVVYLPSISADGELSRSNAPSVVVR